MSRNNVVHQPDEHRGRKWSLCGEKLPDTCPTATEPESELVDCKECPGYEYKGNVLFGYYLVKK